MNFSRLSGRLLVAVPGIALFLLVIFRAPMKWSLFLFFTLSVLAAWEAIQLCCSSGLRSFGAVSSAFLAGASTVLIALEHPLALPSLLLPGLVISLCVMIAIGPDHARRRMAGTAGIMSLYTIGFGIMGMIMIRWGAWSVLGVLFICWAGDSAAYFTGIAFGRHKLMPRVSPAKTWEGLFGGIAGSMAGGLLAAHLGGFSMLPFLVAGFTGGITGILGDLFESALKRDAGIKDSSSLLLGHGGILDRFDSAVAVAPVALAVFTLMELGG